MPKSNLRSVSPQDIIEAARRLRAQANNTGPVLEFTVGKGPDSLFSASYSFDDNDSDDLEVFSMCIDEFAFLLNEVLSE